MVSGGGAGRLASMEESLSLSLSLSLHANLPRVLRVSEPVFNPIGLVF